MINYQTSAKEFGTVNFKGCEYALTSQADHTNRLLNGGYTNYTDAADGEEYDFEMSAPAIDKDCKEFTVYWIFCGLKGENDYQLDDYDYRFPDRVVMDRGE